MHRLTSNIPVYLQKYIVQQDASLYTPMDHASWRFIMKIAHDYFAEHAHEKYLSGLKETGISTERIPMISEMDACLAKFNWRAVAVSGFIPPAVFMEFLSLGILPIACDMRQIEHLAYTPAPDIVHEAAGHAPIIADPAYADYLRNYGEISQKSIYSQHDLNVYEAIRALSDIKEHPNSTPAEISEAQKQLDDAVAAVDHVSEATQLARMSWWTIEYGLVGGMGNPKIYGAGLLSSVGESYHCLNPEVKKIPFDLNCINMTYDITKPQPQLYVAENFEELSRVLEQFGNTLAFRRGGVEGLKKAKLAKTTTTTVLDSGVSMSGTLADFRLNAAGEPIFLKFSSPTQIACNGRQIQGQGADYHREGFSSPIGKVNGKTPQELSDSELGNEIRFDSGIIVKGNLVEKIKASGKNQILVFENCTVTFGNEVLFRPEWGKFDMVCGDQVVSVHGGPADFPPFLEATGGFQQKPGRPKTNLTPKNSELNKLYARVREIRENKTASVEFLGSVANELDRNYSDDWLLTFEILEILQDFKLTVPWKKTLTDRLSKVSKTSKEKSELIQRGLQTL